MDIEPSLSGSGACDELLEVSDLEDLGVFGRRINEGILKRPLRELVELPDSGERRVDEGEVRRLGV